MNFKYAMARNIAQYYKKYKKLLFKKISLHVTSTVTCEHIGLITYILF